jgi:hypothetical protein
MCRCRLVSKESRSSYVPSQRPLSLFFLVVDNPYKISGVLTGMRVEKGEDRVFMEIHDSGKNHTLITENGPFRCTK